MTDWIDLSTVASSVIGSLIAGVLLVSTVPFWWKWVKPDSAVRIGKKIFAFAVLLALVIGPPLILEYQERSSIPRFHPTLTEEEAKSAFLACEKESITATAQVTPPSDRSVARQKYRAACLIEKGFEWE